MLTVWLPWLDFRSVRAMIKSGFAALISTFIRFATVTDYPIISVAFSNKHFFFTFVILMFCCWSTVALLQAAICSMYFLVPGFSGENSLYLGHAAIRKERRSKRSAEIGDSSESFCLGVAYVTPAPIPLARAWHMAKPKATSRKHSKLHCYEWMCNPLTEMWVRVKDCKPLLTPPTKVTLMPSTIPGT